MLSGSDKNHKRMKSSIKKNIRDENSRAFRERTSMDSESKRTMNLSLQNLITSNEKFETNGVQSITWGNIDHFKEAVKDRDLHVSIKADGIRALISRKSECPILKDLILQEIYHRNMRLKYLVYLVAVIMDLFLNPSW